MLTADEALSREVRRGMTREDLLRRAAALGIVVAGVSFGPLTEAALAQARIRRGGTFRLGVAGGGATDFIDGQNIVNEPDIARNVITFEGLAYFDEAYRPKIDGLAEELRAEKADQWLIRVRDGIEFHNGKTLTADDVIYSIRRMSNKKLGMFGVAAFEAVDPNRIRKLDRRTVRLFLKRPDVALLDAFCQYFNGIVPVGYSPNSGRGKGPLRFIGTGPFKVKEFRPGDVVVYEMNENFREPDKPYFAQVELKGGGDAQTAAQAVLQTGEVDYAWNLQVPAQVLDQLERAGVGVVEIIEGVNVERILVNMTDPRKEVDGERSKLGVPHPWQSDLKVRQAYALACQRDVIANTLYGRAGKATANILVAPERFVSKNTSWKFDLNEAAKLLDEAGWTKGPDGVRQKGGVRMEIVYQTTINPVRQRTQEIIKSAFEQLGIKVELKSIDARVFFSSDPGNPDTASHFYADIEMFTNGPASTYPIDYMISWYGKPDNIAQKENNWSGNNYERWQNEEYDKLFEQAQSELDPKKQEELFIKMNDLVVNNVVVIPLVHRNGVSGRAKNLTGLELSRWTDETWNIANWRRTS
ncbi:MAG: peptide ABC transporter substrate-binding protein [Thermomicrobium sp.]|nr:peptide ABC transporter substrate-binding protein [Thermomicrobium sp.]